jgi:hypothetical protein
MSPVLAAMFALTVVLKPDFSGSDLTTEPREPLEGDLVTFTARLVNTGDEESGDTRIDLTFPSEGFFIDVADLEGATIDRAARRLSASVT